MPYNATKHLKYLVLFVYLITFYGYSQNIDSLRLAKLSKENYSLFLRLQNNYKTKAEIIDDFLNKNKGLTKRNIVNGKVYEIVDVINGRPLYVTTYNEQAATSTKTNRLHPNGSLNLNLEGSGITVGVWDAGPVEASHDEFIIDPSASSPVSRVTVVDTHQDVDNHATHVSGTIGAKGSDSSAKGMAPKATILSYDWTRDSSEVLLSISNNNLLLSNHSYGVPVQEDDGTIIDSWIMGCYDSSAREWDEVLYNNPNYLMVCSAGNAGNTTYQGGLADGFDKLTTEKNAKNNLVVANANPQTAIFTGDLTSFPINSGSSQGPTDDVRIKPDIAGDGTNLYSSITGNAYSTYSGTSMSSPNVTGSLALLQEYYHDLYSKYMLASTLKGLVCHTAIDDNSNVGPDPFFGWGLLNAEEAAKTILKSTNGGAKIIEGTLKEGETFTLNFSVSNISRISATLCWTDLPGTAQDNILNSPTSVLVNDLDIRVSNANNTYYPYVLKLNGNTIAAHKEDNNLDNLERIDVENAAVGEYTLSISHKGNLQGIGGGPFESYDQNFSLIVTGGGLTLSNPNSMDYNDNHIHIYPTPAKELILIEFLGESIDSIREVLLYDLSGKLILTKKIEKGLKSAIISLSDYTNGAYVAVIKTDNFIYNKIIIKE